MLTPNSYQRKTALRIVPWQVFQSSSIREIISKLHNSSQLRASVTTVCLMTTKKPKCTGIKKPDRSHQLEWDGCALPYRGFRIWRADLPHLFPSRGRRCSFYIHFCITSNLTVANKETAGNKNKHRSQIKSVALVS